MKKSPWDSYVLIKDEDDDQNRKALFTTVMEPYEKTPYIDQVCSMDKISESSELSDDFLPTGIEITYKDGLYRDVIVCSPCGKTVRYKDSKGQEVTSDACALLIRYKQNDMVYYEALGYTFVQCTDLLLQSTHRMWEGVVKDVSLDKRTVTVHCTNFSPDDCDISNAVGFIHNDRYKKPSPYYLRNNKTEGDNMIFTSDISLIRGEEDWQGSEKRLVQQGKSTVEYQGRRVLTDVAPEDRFYVRNRTVKYVKD